MKHAEFHEALALRLYGELDEPESERLARHLAACAPCRAFAAELERGLGSLAPGASRAEPDLPAGWVARLRAAAAEPAVVQRRRGSAWLAAAAGFAAGALVIGLWRDAASPLTHAPEARTAFARDAAPPRAAEGSRFERLGLYALR